MFIEPTIAWVPSGFSRYIWLDTKLCLKNKLISVLSPALQTRRLSRPAGSPDLQALQTRWLFKPAGSPDLQAFTKPVGSPDPPALQGVQTRRLSRPAGSPGPPALQTCRLSPNPLARQTHRLFRPTGSPDPPALQTQAFQTRRQLGFNYLNILISLYTYIMVSSRFAESRFQYSVIMNINTPFYTGVTMLCRRPFHLPACTRHWRSRLSSACKRCLFPRAGFLPISAGREC